MNFNELSMFLKGNSNPQQFIYNMIAEKTNGNQLFANLLSLARAGKGNEIEMIARNIMREKGFDFDKEFSSFRRTLGL